jgi:GLPGLI family protein
MRKSIVLSFLCCLIVQFCIAQAVEVTYTQQVKNIPQKARADMSDAALKFLFTTHAVLQATNDVSWYQELGEMVFTEKKTNKDLPANLPLKQEEITSIQAEKVYRKSLNDTYKSFKEQSLVLIYRSVAHVFRIEEVLPAYNWTITNEVATIAGLVCKKATTMTTMQPQLPVEAWFTDEIPISSGPGSFHGLPGLILKIETPVFSIAADKVRFVAPPIIKKPTEGELTTSEQLMQRISQRPKSDN